MRLDINILIFLSFGLCSRKVVGSLLELRELREKLDLDGRNHGMSGTWHNLSRDSQLTPRLNHRRGKPVGEHETSSAVQQVIRDSMDESMFNFSLEKDFHLLNASEESSGNESGEISQGRNETDHFQWTDLGWADAALVTLFCSIIAGTVAGNMLVIAAVVTTRRLRTVTNCFVMSLAVADWLVGMFVMPPKVFLYLVDNEWRLGRIFCELWISLDILLCTASILSLCAISIDRYLAITRPLAYSRRRRSKRLALSMISCVWIAAVVITSPPIFGWYEENRNTQNKCDYNENTGYVVYSALGSFFLPLLVMLYVYARIACVIMRRQRSIQKLHARGDRKSQHCGSDAEEPLHQKDREDEVGNGDGTDKLSHQIAGLTGDEGECQEPHEKVNESSAEPVPRNQQSLLGRLRLSSCTGANKEDYEDAKNNRKGGEHQNRQGKHGDGTLSGNGENADAAISLPDPATLAGTGGENLTTGDQEICALTHTNSNPIQQEQLHATSSRRHNHQYVSRLKTGSRLCHHSISTASPQKNIHRIHQASVSSRDFGDHEIHGKSSGSSRSLEKSPRVWTVERTGSPPLTGKRKGKDKNNSNCRSCSYEHELVEPGNPVKDKSTSQMESVMMIDCSPAGNPASLMSAASSAGNSNPIPSPHDKRNFANRIPSRIYQPHNTQSSHKIIPNNLTPSGMQRVKSMKFVTGLHPNDQNHNGGTSSRDFSSGRIASFKRETKTAQTLAAVVGGFIICWLPFFVAYIMGPFTPTSDTIPPALMDALIWLGWSNSAINPFIYAFYSDQFRSAFWRLTVQKFMAVLNRNHSRSSPRRYEDPPQQQRVSA